MEHTEAGSGEAKTWREGAVVEAGAEAILNNLSQESWKSDTILSCWRCELLSDESTGELSWSLGDIRWAQYLVLLLLR